MNLKIIGGVNYKEVEDLIRKTEVKPKIEKRGKIFRRKLYEVYPSSDQRYSLAFKYAGELRWGPAFYNLVIESKEERRKNLIRDFGSRFFLCDYYRNNSPWLDTSNRFILVEIQTKTGNVMTENLSVFDINRNNEMIIATEQMLEFLSKSKNGNYILYKVYRKEGPFNEVKLFNLNINNTILIGKGFYPQVYFAFLDKEEKHIIAIDQYVTPAIKIFSLPNLELLYSEDINLGILDSINRVLPEIKKPLLGFKKWKEEHAIKYKGEDKNWYAVMFNDQYNILYLGKQYETYWANEKYYQDIEWVKAVLEI